MALTPQQTEELRRLIGRRRQALLAEIRSDVARAREEPFGELAGPAPDAGDQSVADLISDLDQAEVSRDLGELRGLEAARGRIAGGSYGICADCGSDIGVERLRAELAALRCVVCQRQHERTFATPGGARL